MFDEINEANELCNPVSLNTSISRFSLAMLPGGAVGSIAFFAYESDPFRDAVCKIFSESHKGTYDHISETPDFIVLYGDMVYARICQPVCLPTRLPSCSSIRYFKLGNYWNQNCGIWLVRTSRGWSTKRRMFRPGFLWTARLVEVWRNYFAYIIFQRQLVKWIGGMSEINTKLHIVPAALTGSSTYSP